VAQAQILGVGLNIGAAILNQIFPTWLMQTSGPESGGFFATHPGTADRIVALRKLP
jgi:Zn-dependent protease with chaperone function